jgi:uncharacterized protein (DUF1810 family)
MPTGASSASIDPYNLRRFVEAQDQVYQGVLAELKLGRKRTHWMWFVFPQIQGLGFSAISQRFAIGSLDEADAYLKYPVLGVRLVECVEAVLEVEGRLASQIFGSPDDMKFRSSMTLFSHVKAAPRVFRDALDKYFNGEEDQLTIERL